jgi:hypothetical protein
VGGQRPPHQARARTQDRQADSQWLAVLARFGLVRASFIPPRDLRELRLVSRYRRRLSAMCACEINRLHKILDDGGIKLGGVTSDINGVSARAMVSALIEGKPIEHMLGLARGKLQQRREELGASLDGDLRPDFDRSGAHGPGSVKVGSEASGWPRIEADVRLAWRAARAAACTAGTTARCRSSTSRR